MNTHVIHLAWAGFRQHNSTDQQTAILSQHLKDNTDIDFESAYNSIYL